MTSTKTIRGLLAATLLFGTAAAPAFAQGGATSTAPAAPANRPAAATAPHSAAGTSTTGPATPSNRPAVAAPATPNGAAAPRPIAPAERQGSAVTPGAGGRAGPSGTVQGGGAARAN